MNKFDIGTPEIPKKYATHFLKKASSLLKDMIKNAVINQKEIILFGDSDTDGVSSTAILYLFLRLLGVNSVSYVISNRKEDDYGLSLKACDRILASRGDKNKSASIIAMDLGVRNVEGAKYLLDHGCDLLIIDHHAPHHDTLQKLIELYKIYNMEGGSTRFFSYDPILYLAADDDEKHLSHLSAAGLCFYVALDLINNPEHGLKEAIASIQAAKIFPYSREVSAKKTILNTMIKIAGIAQSADVMPFKHDNMYTLAWGLASHYEKNMDVALLAGVAELYKLTATASRTGWVISPLLNAAGRIDNPIKAFELLIEDNMSVAKKRLDDLFSIREEVQSLTKSASISYSDKIKTSKGVRIIVFDEKEVASGVLGIIASRASEALRSPVACMAYKASVTEGGKSYIAGSMRSGMTDFNCEKWIASLEKEGIAAKGGGHASAAGLSIYTDKFLDLLKNAESQTYVSIAAKRDLYEVEDVKEYLSLVTQILPFGRGNESLEFNIRGVISHIKPLSFRDKDGVTKIFSYLLSIYSKKSNSTLEIRVSADKITASMSLLFKSLAGLSVHLPIVATLEVIDSLKKDSKYDRLSVNPKNISRSISDEKDASSSLSYASLRLLSKEEESLSDEELSFDFYTANLSGTPVMEGIKDKIDERTQIIIDRDATDHPRTFRLSRPSKDDINKRWGNGKNEEVSEELASLHGGVWAKGNYRITAGVVDHLLSQNVSNHPKFKFVLSEQAKTHYETLKKSDADFKDLLKNTSTYDLHFLKDGFTPTDYQYADVRFYMTRGQISLCHNDMGTGKTFEAGMFAGLNYLNASFGQDGSLSYDLDKENKPVLVITKKGIIGQMRDEFDRMFNLNASPISIDDINDFMKTITQEDITYVDDGKKIKSILKKAKNSPVKNETVSKTISLIPVPVETKKSTIFAPSEALKAYMEDANIEKIDLYCDGSSIVLSLRNIKMAIDGSMYSSSSYIYPVGDNGLSEKPDANTLEDMIIKFMEQRKKLSKILLKEIKKGFTPYSLLSSPRKKIGDLSPEASIKFKEKFLKDRGIILVTYDTIASCPFIIKSLQFSALILDESDEVKNIKSNAARALFGDDISISHLKGARLLAMSGTPMKNRPADYFIWTRLTEADGGVYSSGRLDDASRRFDMRFDGLTFEVCYWNKKLIARAKAAGKAPPMTPKRGEPKHGEELQYLFFPLSVRRLKNEIDGLPEIDVFKHRVSSSGLIFNYLASSLGKASIDEKFKELLNRYDLNSEEGEGELKAGSKASRLHLISSLDKASNIVSHLGGLGWLNPKEGAISPLDIEPIVLIGSHKCAVKEAASCLEAAGYEVYLMMQEHTAEERQKMKEGFQNGNRQIFITTYKVGGVGLNLTRANRMALIGLPLNDSAAQQARDRIHRIGQKRKCSVAVFLLNGSLDERIWEIITMKGKASEKILNMNLLRLEKEALPEWAKKTGISSQASLSAKGKEQDPTIVYKDGYKYQSIKGLMSGEKKKA